MQDITFEGIKTQLKEYFSKQDVFKDYHWTSPAATTLIDALAYMAHYVTVYSNFSLNESFLDTAILRSSILSKAKNIGYVPYQYKSAIGKVRFIYNNLDDIPKNGVILAGATLSVVVDEKKLLFRTVSNAIVEQTSMGRYFADADIIEGTFVQNSWTQNETSEMAFVLNNKQVDLDHMEITVRESEHTSLSDVCTVIDRNVNIGYIDPDKYYCNLIENKNEQLQLFFGDDILFRAIHPGNYVSCVYLVSNGSLGNNINAFTLQSFDNNNAFDTTGWTVEVLTVTHSGADKESNESIRINAPKFFQRQYRNVTAEDYKTHLLSEYGGLIEDSNAWGGETNDPPEYGTVFLCVKPKIGNVLTDYQKEIISEELSKSSVIGIQIKLTDPNVLYVNMDLDILYDRLYSKQTNNSIKEQALELTNEYLAGTNTFNSSFVYSKYISNIFSIDEHILDVTTDIVIGQYLVPVNNSSINYLIDFRNEIVPGSINSTIFYDLSDINTTLQIVDDGKGVLLQNATFNNETFSTVIGSVDYTTGILIIQNYSFNYVPNEQIQFFMKPENNNMVADKNYVFSLDNVDIKVTSKN